MIAGENYIEANRIKSSDVSQLAFNEWLLAGVADRRTGSNKDLTMKTIMLHGKPAIYYVVESYINIGGGNYYGETTPFDDFHEAIEEYNRIDIYAQPKEGEYE